jgi:putative transposase
VGRRYVPYFNRKYGRSGTLWEGRFKASTIESRRYLLTC